MDYPKIIIQLNLKLIKLYLNEQDDKMRGKLKISMLIFVLLLLNSLIGAVSAVNIYNINESSYSDYFDATGYINNPSVQAGDVLDCSGTLTNKDIFIDRALNITSTDQTAQIINGTITILNSGSGTNITRLKINNSLDCCKGIYLLNTTNNTIKENIIHCDGITGYGICLVGSSYNQIIENNLSESNAINGWQHSPIILGDSHYNDINYNYIVSNISNNIYLCTYSFADYSNGNPSTYNNIIGNTLFGVDNSWCYAIQIMGLYNTISNNTITGAYRGISSDLSTEMGGEITGGSNIITGNTISATNCGIYFGSNCTVAENTINSYNTTRNAIQTSGSNSTIINNSINMANGGNGISIHGSDNQVTGNIINNVTNGYGICIYSPNNTVTENEITTTGTQESIYIYGANSCNNISNNIIYSNSTGIFLKKQSSSKIPTSTIISNNQIITTSTYAVDSSDGSSSSITNNSLSSDNGNKMGNDTVNSDNSDIVSGNYGGTLEADFTVDKSSGNPPFTVQFTDQSTGNILSYEWDFQNDGTIDSTEQNPSYTYTSIGFYTAKLTVTGPDSTDEKAMNITVQTDSTAPTIIASSPANGETSITNESINVSFSEDIMERTGWIELVNSSGTAIPFSMSINGNVLTINPTNALEEAAYKLMIHSGSVTDMAGNPLTGQSIRFTVGTAPTITATSPSNGTTNVSANKTITVTFSEAIRKSSNFWVELINSTGESISYSSYITGGNVLVINPDSALTEFSYKLMVHSGSVTDMAGNPLTGQSFRFTAGTSPTVTSTTPVDGSTNISPAKTLTVTFSENIRKSSSFWVELVDGTGDSIDYTSYITSGNILVINPVNDLTTNTIYKIKLHTGCVTDLAGNLLAGKSISFTTRDT